MQMSSSPTRNHEPSLSTSCANATRTSLFGRVKEKDTRAVDVDAVEINPPTMKVKCLPAEIG